MEITTTNVILFEIKIPKKAPETGCADHLCLKSSVTITFDSVDYFVVKAQIFENGSPKLKNILPDYYFVKPDSSSLKKTIEIESLINGSNLPNYKTARLTVQFYIEGKSYRSAEFPITFRSC